MLRRSTVASTTTMTVYAFGLEEHLYSGTGVTQGNTYYDSLAGHLVGESTGSSANAFLTDALGSVITTLSATAGSAAVQGNQAYGPYGNTRYQAGTMGTAKGFTGQYQDATGLDYYNARYYDPVVGRFVSADTAEGNGSGRDPYAYVDGNPETKNDPTGQSGCDLIFPITCLPPSIGCGIFPLACLAQIPIPPIPVPAPPKSRWFIVAAAILALAILIAHFATSTTNQINAADQWTVARQRQIAVELAQEIDQERIIRNDTSRAIWGKGYIEVIHSRQVVDSAPLPFTRGQNNYNPDIEEGAINATHNERLTVNWAKEWIKDHYNELHAGDTINLMIYTQGYPCRPCQNSFDRWATELQNTVPPGVNVVLYIWYQRDFDKNDPLGNLVTPQSPILLYRIIKK